MEEEARDHDKLVPHKLQCCKWNLYRDKTDKVIEMPQIAFRIKCAPRAKLAFTSYTNGAIKSTQVATVTKSIHVRIIENTPICITMQKKEAISCMYICAKQDRYFSALCVPRCTPATDERYACVIPCSTIILTIVSLNSTSSTRRYCNYDKNYEEHGRVIKVGTVISHGYLRSPLNLPAIVANTASSSSSGTHCSREYILE